MPLMEFTNRTINCAECGDEFLFSAGEQAFFSERGFVNDPKRCPACRAKRRIPPQRSIHPETQAICAGCGLETTVPFKPTQGRPVLCHLCFKKTKELAS